MNKDELWMFLKNNKKVFALYSVVLILIAGIFFILRSTAPVIENSVVEEKVKYLSTEEKMKLLESIATSSSGSTTDEKLKALDSVPQTGSELSTEEKLRLLDSIE